MCRPSSASPARSHPTYTSVIWWTLAGAIRPAAIAADVVVLAQASMAPVAAELADSGIEVLGSPGLGVPTPWQRCAHRARRGQRRP
jgi:hypothetical protein